jgi:site-specific DNA-adenine methylase
MFGYYGSKWRIAPHYSPPLHKTIIEPFAGSACYSLMYPDHKVILNDLNPNIAELWRYLIHEKTTREEILSIPNVRTEEDLKKLSPSQQILVGFWFAKARVEPATKPTGWMNEEGGEKYKHHYWGQRRKERIANQVKFIKHWKVLEGPYEDIPNQDATWFVDPPYSGEAGRAYTCQVGSGDSPDYLRLAGWCTERQGQVIVCENLGANWLEFKELGEFKTVRQGISKEVYWEQGGNMKAGTTLAEKTCDFCHVVYKKDNKGHKTGICIQESVVIASKSTETLLRELHELQASFTEQIQSKKDEIMKSL